MERLERISRGVARAMEVGMKAAGLVTAVDELLVDPRHATSLRLLLSGVLLMGGQATKDLVFGLVDRVMQAEHREEPREPREPE